MQQRDTEIGILVKMLHQQGSQIPYPANEAAAGSLSSSLAASMQQEASQARKDQQQQGSAAATSSRGATGHTGELLSALLDVNLLADRNKAFEMFRRSYRQNEVRSPSAKQMLLSRYCCQAAAGLMAAGDQAVTSMLLRFGY